MDNIKIIDISNNYSYSNKNNKLSKKQLYKEILSSSNKVKDIIKNRKKTRRFDYLNTIPLKENNNLRSQPPPYQYIESVSNKNFIPIKQNTELYHYPHSISKNDIVQPIHTSTICTQHIKHTSKYSKPPKTIDTYFKSHPKDNYFNPKKSSSSSSIKINRTPSPNNITSSNLINKFNKDTLVKVIKIIYMLQNNEETLTLHKIIRKLNRFKIIQILFALRLLNKNSNAPIDLLKNSLFNYITGNVKIVRNNE